MLSTDFKKMSLMAIFLNGLLVVVSFIINEMVSMYSIPMFIVFIGLNCYFMYRTIRYNPNTEENEAEIREGGNLKKILMMVLVVSTCYSLLTIINIIKLL